MLDLPVRDVLPALDDALAIGNAALVAPPGAGKTTLAPLHLLQADWLRGGIVMLEPRRLAARAAATRMSALLGETVGNPGLDVLDIPVVSAIAHEAFVLQEVSHNLGVHLPVRRIDVDEDGPGAGITNGIRGGDEGQVGHQTLVILSYTSHQQGRV